MIDLVPALKQVDPLVNKMNVGYRLGEILYNIFKQAAGYVDAAVPDALTAAINTIDRNGSPYIDYKTNKLRLGDDGRTIEEAAFTGHGCAVSQASADMMADLITGESVDEARRLCELFIGMVQGKELSDQDREDLDEAAELETISRMPARVKCAELAWRTLEGMLAEQV